MKTKIKNAVAITIAGILSSCIVSSTAFSEDYHIESQSVLIGDVDGDGGISTNDALAIQQYLGGVVSPTQRQFTAMDVNMDFVVDNSDCNTILYWFATGDVKQKTTNTLYDLPEDTSAVYRKHDCSSSDTQQYEGYTLKKPTATISLSENSAALESVAPEFPDSSNINCVKLKMETENGDTYIGSGFIVGSHQVATAAHCVLDSSSKGVFMKNIEVTATDDLNGYSQTTKAKSLHVPENYINPGSDSRDNYDYALIYVEDDLSKFGICPLGIMTNEFSSTSSSLFVSGYTTENNNYGRYFSYGQIQKIPSGDLNDPAKRFTCLAHCKGGKSGGLTYFESKYESTTVKSAVGIITGAGSTGQTWGTKITPTVARFLLQD